MGNTAKQCRLGLFQDSDFAGDLEDSKSSSDGTLCILGSHTFVPISWMCKKQSSVSHKSTESEIISLDAGLRLDGIPALDLWDLIVAVLHGNTNQNRIERRDLLLNKREVCSPPHTIHKRKKSHGMINDLDNVDFISSNVNSSRQEAVLFIFEDNEAVIKMIIKGRSPTMRHVSRTHRGALDWFFDRINLDPKIQIKYTDTKNQLADILTKGNFTRDEWNQLLCLFNISHFSSTDCLEVDVEKNAKIFRWRKSHSKIEADDEFGLAMQRKGSWRACLHCIWKPGRHQIWKSECTSELVNCASTKNGETCICWLAHQIPQNGTMTTSGLLKWGTLVKCREQVRGDP